jgi:hypothetical protein
VPIQNRVTPHGELIAVPDRGIFWGNRGRLLDACGNLTRHCTGRDWAICVLDYKGIRRPLWTPGKLTELFFLDEATGLAAGHRPCGQCRYRDYRNFKMAYAAAHPGEHVTAPAIDARLHADRLLGASTKRTFPARVDRLPDGSFIELDGRSWLVLDDELLAWTPSGYTDRRPRSNVREAIVLTPRATVHTLAAGYHPVLHVSAR